MKPLNSQVRGFITARRFATLAAALIVIAVIAFITGGHFESWRAARDWLQCKADLEARGEHLSIDDFVPPPVPDDQNFALSPLMKPLFEVVKDPKTGESTHGDSPLTKIRDNIPDSPASYPSLASWQTGHFRSLDALQAYYRESLSGTGLNKSAPEDVLTAMRGFDNTFAELRREIQTRPLCRYPLHYEAGMAMALPHLSPLTNVVRVLALRASAELALGRTDAAFDDVELGYRLYDTIRDEPVLISGLVRTTLIAILQQPMWEGIAAHRWNAAQLSALEEEFRRQDFIADFDRCIRSERCAGNWICETIRHDPKALKQISGSDSAYSRVLTSALNRSWLTAATYRNQIFMNTFYQRELLTLFDVQTRTVSVPRAKSVADAAKAISPTPYTLLARLALPVFSAIAIKFAQEQTYIDEAAIACEIERYRLAHGTLPTTLDALQMAALPHDIINGQPPRYRVVAPDNYLLYSVGWNETDDGGTVARDEKGNVNGKSSEQGDWVWTLKPL
jgi:hypothetical protein